MQAVELYARALYASINTAESMCEANRQLKIIQTHVTTTLITHIELAMVPSEEIKHLLKDDLMPEVTQFLSLLAEDGYLQSLSRICYAFESLLIQAGLWHQLRIVSASKLKEATYLAILAKAKTMISLDTCSVLFQVDAEHFGGFSVYLDGKTILLASGRRLDQIMKGVML